MLFAVGKSSFHSLAVFKHISEIIISQDEKLYDKLYKINANNLLASVKGKVSSDASSLEVVCQYFLDQGKDLDFVAWFKAEVTKMHLTFDVEYLTSEYCRVPYLQQQLRRRLEREVRNHRAMVGAISDTDWMTVLGDFTEFVKKYSSGYSYNPVTNGIVPFLVKHFSARYLLSKGKQILEMLNVTGLNAAYAGADYSAGDLQVVDTQIHDDLMNFDDIARKIYDVGDFMYRHNGIVYYDLFSRYKFKQATLKFERIRKSFEDTFEFASIYRKPVLVDENFDSKKQFVAAAEQNARKKMKKKEPAFEILDSIMEDRVGAADIGLLIESLERVNEQIYYDSSYGKDQLPFLAFGEYKPKDKIGNDAKLQRLILGMCALRDLVRYLKRSDVNVFRVPSTIFKDEKYIRRFKTYNQYRKLYDLVVELVEEPGEDQSAFFVSNDELYAQFFDRSQQLKRAGFGGIRQAFDQYLEEGKTTTSRFLIDAQKAVVAKQKINSFYKADVPSKDPLINVAKSLVRQITVTLIKEMHAKEALENDKIYWHVNFPTREFLNQKFGEALIDKILNFFQVDFSNDERLALNMLRLTLMINKMMIHTDKLASFVENSANQTSELNLFRSIQQQESLFGLPKNPRNVVDFIELLDVDPYLAKGMDLSDISKNMVRMYTLLRGSFAELYEYTDDLYEKRYLKLLRSMGLTEQTASDVPERWLANAATDLYVMAGKSPSVNSAMFMELRQRCDPQADNLTGFLKRQGKVFKVIRLGFPWYLHETGYWVHFRSDRDWLVNPVVDDEQFTVG